MNSEVSSNVHTEHASAGGLPREITDVAAAINAENAAPVIEAGADAICVTAAVGAAPDPEDAAAQLVKVIENAGGRV